MPRRLQPARNFRLTDGLAIAAVEHGPGMHGGVLVMALLAIALAAGVVYLVKRRKQEHGGPMRERGHEASAASPEVRDRSRGG